MLVEDTCRRTAKLLFPDMKDFDAYEYKLFIPDTTGGRIIMEDKRLLASFKFKPRVRVLFSSSVFPLAIPFKVCILCSLRLQIWIGLGWRFGRPLRICKIISRSPI